jgi:hypothetical protein
MSTKDQNQNKNKVLCQFLDTDRKKPAIIFGCGPSLNNFEVEKLGLEGYVSIVMKMAIMRPDIYKHVDYYFFGDNNEKSRLYEPMLNDLTCVKFGLVYQNGVIIPERTYTDKFCKEVGAHPLAISYQFGFQKDVCRYPMYRCSTMFPCLQFALWIGCNPIYVVGMDCSEHHSFMKEDQSVRGAGQNLMKKMPEHLNKFMHFKKHNYNKRTIYHVNPDKIHKVFDKDIVL